jgi:hypothetical protein
VRHPEPGDHQKAQDIGQVTRPQIQQRFRQVGVARRGRDCDFKDQQGDGDGEYAVGQRQDPADTLLRRFVVLLPRQRRSSMFSTECGPSGSIQRTRRPGGGPRAGGGLKYKRCALVIPDPGRLIHDHHAGRPVRVLRFTRSWLDHHVQHPHPVVVQQDTV